MLHPFYENRFTHPFFKGVGGDFFIPFAKSLKSSFIKGDLTEYSLSFPLIFPVIPAEVGIYVFKILDSLFRGNDNLYHLYNDIGGSRFKEIYEFYM